MIILLRKVQSSGEHNIPHWLLLFSMTSDTFRIFASYFQNFNNYFNSTLKILKDNWKKFELIN